MSFVIYCLSVFFAFYVFNYADITAQCREWVLARVSENVAYALTCAFCTTFHVTLIAALWGAVPISWAFAAPVVNLFLIKSFQRLCLPS